MSEQTKNIWWGYKHTNGSFQAKRYFDERDIEEANDSPLCEKVVLPFQAIDREDALRIVEEKSTVSASNPGRDVYGIYF